MSATPPRPDVELYGGPLDGSRHTFKYPFGPGFEPDEMGVPVDGPERDRAWYRRNDGTGRYDFMYLELRPPATEGA